MLRHSSPRVLDEARRCGCGGSGVMLAEVSIRCADRWDRGECRVAIRVVRNSRGLRIVIHREHPTRKVYQTRVEDWPALKDLWRLGASLENQWRSPLLCPRADYQGHSVGINESNTLRMGRAFLVISADPIRVVCTFMCPWNGSRAEVQAFYCGPIGDGGGRRGVSSIPCSARSCAEADGGERPVRGFIDVVDGRDVRRLSRPPLRTRNRTGNWYASGRQNPGLLRCAANT